MSQEDRKENRSAKKKSTEVGPWGGNGGNRWDDGSYHGVREITLVFGHCIDSICVVYDKNGKPVAAEKHGGVGGNQMAEIKQQFPDEHLVSVSGYYCPVVRGGSPVITSLTFKCNKRTFGAVRDGTRHAILFPGGRWPDSRIQGMKGLVPRFYWVPQCPMLNRQSYFRGLKRTFRRLACTAVFKTSDGAEERSGWTPLK